VARDRRAVLIDDIKAIPGYVGGRLLPDASTSDLPSEKKSDEMAILTDYLERPSAKYPKGRRCFIANDRVVVDFRKDPSARRTRTGTRGTRTSTRRASCATSPSCTACRTR
jgi:hypothetical protein